MKMWSRGLGRTEIIMDFRRYQVTQDKSSGDVLISGNITDPVNWEFRITMTPDDVGGMLKVVFHWCVIRMLLLNFYRYFVYLFRRKDYQPKQGVELVQKVDQAYLRFMNRSRPKPLPTKKKTA